jgi:hypothetical protein
MMIKIWLYAAAAGVVIAGCGLSQRAEAEPVEANLNEVFTLGGDQEATISGEDLRLRFAQVLEDSRCPTQVECFWTGQARIAILVSPTGREPALTEFNTNPAPGQGILTARVGEYTIEFSSLDPYPQTIDEAIPLDEYRATLSVRKAAR